MHRARYTQRQQPSKLTRTAYAIRRSSAPGSRASPDECWDEPVTPPADPLAAPAAAPLEGPLATPPAPPPAAAPGAGDRCAVRPRTISTWERSTAWLLTIVCTRTDSASTLEMVVDTSVERWSMLACILAARLSASLKLKVITRVSCVTASAAVAAAGLLPSRDVRRLGDGERDAEAARSRRPEGGTTGRGPSPLAARICSTSSSVTSRRSTREEKLASVAAGQSMALSPKFTATSLPPPRPAPRRAAGPPAPRPPPRPAPPRAPARPALPRLEARAGLLPPARRGSEAQDRSLSPAGRPALPDAAALPPPFDRPTVPPAVGVWIDSVEGVEL